VSTPSLAEERRTRVREALDQVRAVAATSAAPQAAAIARIKETLVELATRGHLWDLRDFPIADGQLWGVYEISEDEDGRFALYASAALPGHAQPPHNHTTWACIAGVAGVEVNRLYRLVEGDMQAGPGRVEAVEEIALGAGDVMFLQADDIHDIRVAGPAAAMHLHLYGLGLPHLHKRLRFDMATGSWQVFPVFSEIPKI